MLSDIGCSFCGGIGFVEGTPIRLASGSRVVETLSREDRIQVSPTAAMNPSAVQQREIWLDPFDCPAVVRPLLVPPGALGNQTEFLLQQDMRVIMHDSDLVDAIGTGFVSVRAADLEAFRKIRLADPPKRARLITVAFEAEQMVEVAGGAWVICPPLTRDIGAMIRNDTSVSVIDGQKVCHLTSSGSDAFLAMQEALPNAGAPQPLRLA